MRLPLMNPIYSVEIKVGMKIASSLARILMIILNLKFEREIGLKVSMVLASLVLGKMMMLLELYLGKIHPGLKIE